MIPAVRLTAPNPAASLKRGGRLALALNNPYSAVIDRHVTDYLDAFLTAGLHLTKLTDIPALADSRRPDAYLPPGARFPRFMLLAFNKP